MSEPFDRWSSEPFNHWSGDGDVVRLWFRCPEHGLFYELVPLWVARQVSPGRMNSQCRTKEPIRHPFQLATKGMCVALSPWVRSTEDDDPGDE